MTKTLIVIGAGSSKNIHPTFPTGIELAIWLDAHLITTKKTADDHNNHPDCPYISSMINEAKRVFNYDTNYLDKLVDRLKVGLWSYTRTYDYHYYRNEAPTISVDELISSQFEAYPQVYSLAKQCVAYLLKGQEDAYLDTVTKTNNTNSAWIENIYATLKSRGALFNDIVNNLTIISFNYERLFEHISCQTLSRLFGTNIKELPNLNYIYGNFGTLSQVPFEVKNNESIFRNHCHGNLKFIGERHKLNNKPNLDNYEKVLFIGFGYDKDNLTDTLAIQNVRTAKLIGMCRNLNSRYLKIGADFKIKMIECGDRIDSFISGQL
ncbi:hypothetical protein [Chryseolinea sp. H1M3-3]|uniref:hypothetical protein n=1 Tax=Chryseolinea sp. H1M3-3 TaxID=3034144 RepID=UPI0023EB45D4|nr:hypothetical protein [Chryseolinea sp. H1M3-3]